MSRHFEVKQQSALNSIRIYKNAFLWLILFSTILLVCLFLLPEKKHLNTTQLTTDQLVTSEPFRFSDYSLQSGLNHQHTQHTGKITDLIDSLSGSVCIADFDNDGWVDLLFPSGGGQTRYYGAKSWWNKHKNIEIYQNQAGYFVNKTAQSKIDVFGSTTACIAADLNQDGLPDLVIGGVNQSFLFKNLGKFKFEQISEFSSQLKSEWVSHISLLDINQDGLPDLHFSKFIKYKKNQKNLENSTGFSEQHHRQFEPGAFDGIANQLLINQGNFRFSDQTKDYFKHEYADRTLASNWLDLNHDGLLDLIEFNLAEQPTRTYLRNKKNQLVEVMDNQWPLLINHTHFASATQNIKDPSDLLILTRAQGLSNLAINLADGHNNDIAWKAGLNNSNYLYQNRWGISLGDFNNNGLTDFAIASGGYKADPFSPKASIASPNLCGKKSASEQNNIHFELAHCTLGQAQSSRNVSQLDFNNDGKLDLLFVNNNDFPQLLINQSQTNNNWISLSIPDLAKYHSATLKIEAGNKSINRSITLSQSLFGNQDPRFHFGLAEQNSIKITLHTLTGKSIQQTLTANQFYQLNNEHWQVQRFNHKFESNSIVPELEQLNDLATALRWINDSPVTPAVLAHINTLSHQANSNQINEAAKQVKQFPSKNQLAIYTSWLKSEHPELAEAGYYAIEILELENSVHALLDNLAPDANSSEFCQASQIFANWFEEEEAVTQYKYKAVPYFFRALADKDMDKVICSARALGHAEHKNASHAILDVLTQKPEFVQVELVNALGKTRQTEANPAIIKLITTTSNPSIIQQGLIALTRLNQSNLAEIIAQIKNQQAVFIALVNLADATDHIVIKPPARNEWLQRNSQLIEYAKLTSSQARQAYIKAAEQKFVSPIKLWPLLKQADTELACAAASILLNQPTEKLMHLNSEQLLSLINLPLSNNELEKLSLKSPLKQLAQQLNNSSEGFSQQQYSNLLSVFIQLEPQTRQQLVKTLADFPPERLVLAISDCEKNRLDMSSLKANAKSIPANNSLSAFSLSCHLIHSASQQNLVLLKQDTAELISASSAKVELIFAYLTQYFANKDFSHQHKLNLARISATLLTEKNIPQNIKIDWASRYFQMDKTTNSWVKNQVYNKNEKLLNHLLAQGYFETIRSEIDLDKIINSLSLPTKQRLDSFYLQANLTLAEHKEPMQ